MQYMLKSRIHAPHIRYVICFVLLDDILRVFTSLLTGADILANDG